MAIMRVGRFWANFCEEPTPFRRRVTRSVCALAIPSHYQLDDHSCAFVTALNVLKHYHPLTSPRELLGILQPHPGTGRDQGAVIRALRHFGVAASVRVGLGPRGIFNLLVRNSLVIVTVWPEGDECDHWCVIRGIDLVREKIFLVNHGQRRGLTWRGFRDVWWPRGLGLACGSV